MSKHRIFAIRISRVFKSTIIFLLVISGFLAGGSIFAPFSINIDSSWALSAVAAISPAAEKTLIERMFGGGAPLYSVMPIAKSKNPVKKAEKPAGQPAEPAPAKEVTLTVSNAYGYTPLNGIYINNDTGYSFDLEGLLNESLGLKKSGGPMVLILHTHTSEAYTPSEDYSYEPSDPYRTENPKYNVTAVGKKIEDALISRGIGVIHDKTSHDYPSYSGSYKRAMETIEKNLSKYPSIRFVLDIHRDAISDTNGEYLKTTAEIEQKKHAQIMIVVGTDRGGLEHPNWQQNLKSGLKLQRAIINKYPDLARPLHLREERFNGHTSPGALLIEMGCNGNTLNEALLSAELLGECMADMIEAELEG